ARRGERRERAAPGADERPAGDRGRGGVAAVRGRAGSADRPNFVRATDEVEANQRAARGAVRGREGPGRGGAAAGARRAARGRGGEAGAGLARRRARGPGRGRGGAEQGGGRDVSAEKELRETRER